MARTKTNTQNDTKTRTTSWRYGHLEKKLYFCVFGFFFDFFFIYYFLNEFSKKCWVTALVRSMTFIGGLNQFSAIANLTDAFSTFIWEGKKCIYSISNQAT